MANERAAQKGTGSEAPDANSATHIRDSATQGLDQSSPGKGKRDLYLVPDQQLPLSGGDLRDQVETTQEVEHEMDLKLSNTPMPGMSGQTDPLQLKSTQANGTGERIDDQKPLTQVTSLSQVESQKINAINAGGATSGTTAGLGTSDRGSTTDASEAGMTGSGVQGGLSNRGTAGSILTHGPGQSGSQNRKKRGKKKQNS